MRALELKIPPPAVAILIGVAMGFVADHGPVLQLPFFERLALLIVALLAGVGLALAGDLQFKRAQTTINPFRPENTSALVTTGIYRRTRNPMYLGLAVVTLGWAAFLCSALALLGPVAFVLYINRFQIAPEERILSGKFGKEYAEYTSRVRRWL